jgi:predicted amino acid racemase
MSGLRLEIDLEKISHNARTLVDRLATRGIAVTAVTKATLGSPEIAHALLEAGVCDLGDSRIENLETMRRAHVPARMALIRAPMLSQARRVVTSAELSYNSEIETVRRLSLEARKLDRTHAVVLMVELGDLREGFMPVDLMPAVREILELPNIVFKGIGTNLACRSGVSPDDTNMGELSRLATLIETTFDISVDIVSGGNSANLAWAFGGSPAGRINNLRLGESILLGRETLQRQAITGLHTDAITLVAEVSESKSKPTQPSGDLAQTAFGVRAPVANRGEISQTLLAVGIQDVDPDGLVAPDGTEIIGSSSDHLVTTSAADRVPIGSEMRFQLNYSALMRAMTSPFVSRAIQFAGNTVALHETG